MSNAIYFNQADPRWANHLYPSATRPSATIKSGGCGATAAAMVVSSFRDIIYPDQMGDLFVANGQRGNDGTNCSAFPWVAQRYGLKCELKWRLDDAMSCLRAGGMVVALCSAGLFTTGGHYIVLAGLKDSNTIIVYDPYLYTNKFNSYGRNGKATVEGNNVYVTYANFKEYGAYSYLYCFYGDSSINPVPAPTPSAPTTKIMYVNTNSLNLNVRKSPGGAIVGSKAKGTQVSVYAEQSGWSKIGDNEWVSSAYLSSTKPGTNVAPVVTSKYVLGKYVTRAVKGLNVRKEPNTNINSTILKCYKYGTRFDTYEIRNNWAKTPSGWVCLDYCNLVYRYK